MTSIFGFYCVFVLLQDMGWPRRKSLFNSQAIIDSLILDTVINQMIDLASGIGACKPKLALCVIATMLRGNDWNSEESFNILQFINDLEKSWEGRGNTNPRDIVKPVKFSKHQKVTKAKDLKRPKYKNYFRAILLRRFNMGSN